MSPLSLCTSFPATFTNTDTGRPASPQISRPPVSAGTVVHSDLIQPIFDPETGLDLFPRLPENDDDSFAASGGHSTEEETSPESKSSDGNGATLRRNLSTRFAQGVAHFLPKSWSTPSSPVDSESDQHAKAEQSQSYSPTYCKHTWNQTCKCPVILSTSECGYCSICREERCSAGSSLRAARLLEVAAR